MAWDPETTPNLPLDVWTAWQEAVVAEADLAHGWDKAAQEALDSVALERFPRVLEMIGRPEQDADTEEMAAFNGRFKAQLECLLREDGLDGPWRSLFDYRRDTLAPALETWRSAGLQTIIEACGTAAA